MIKALLFLALTFCPVLGLSAPEADLWRYWDQSEESSPQVIDHSSWQTFLDQYVSRGASGVNLVAYDEAAQSGRAHLREYLRTLTDIDPRTLRRQEQLAYWINLYNALTVNVVLDHPGRKTILKMGGGWFSRGPWGDELVEVAGQRLTLDDIEHRILRPIWHDHRVHFAVNCASLGCPDLNAEAFTSANAQRLLTEAEVAYINHPRGVSVEGGRLILSSIFDWYRQDFASNEAELVRYLASRHALAELPSDVIRYRYDWSLNAKPYSKK